MLLAATVDAPSIRISADWGPICFLVCALPYMYWMSRPYGVRRCTVTGIVLVTLGAALRCGAQQDDALSLALWHLSSICIGCAGPAALGAASLLAEMWFPVSQRALAMAVAAEASVLGLAVGYAFPPIFITKSTLVEINHVYVTCFCVCIFLCACACYFPDTPSVHPSRSAAAEHTAGQAVTLSSMKASVWKLLQMRQFVIIVCVYAVTEGCNAAWSGTLNLNLSQVF
jgi:MFS family permease